MSSHAADSSLPDRGRLPHHREVPFQYQVVLAWLLHSRPVALPLIAASTGEQLRENIDALKLQLSPEQMALLSDARDQGS
jgi:aryl-alcohol dehydrogenase-like predicted oxidoreductase